MSAVYLNVLVLINFVLYTNGRKIIFTPNVECDTYLGYVQTDRHYKYYPYVVKLHQCFGKTSATHNYGCIPKTSEEVELRVRELAKSNFTNILLSNITSCEEHCTLKPSHCNQYEQLNNDTCICDCLHNRPPASCMLPFHWDHSLCNCVCPLSAETYTCEKGKTFDEDLCRCVCKKRLKKKCARRNKEIDPESCHCIDHVRVAETSQPCEKGGVSKAVVCVIVVVEFVIIIAVYFVCKVYCDDKFQLRKGIKNDDADSLEKEEFSLVQT